MSRAEQTFTAYFDLDRTCYDTDQFRTDLLADLALRADRDPEEVKTDAARFKIHPRLGGYSYEAHATTYGLDAQESWSSVARLAESKNYLLDGAAELVTGVQQDGVRARILTFGEPRLQMIKMRPYLGLLAIDGRSSIGYDITLQTKADFLAQRRPGGPGSLLDDVPNQQLPEGYAEIHFDPTADLPAIEGGTTQFRVSDYAQAAQAIRVAAEY